MYHFLSMELLATPNGKGIVPSPAQTSDPVNRMLASDPRVSPTPGSDETLPFDQEVQS